MSKPTIPQTDPASQTPDPKPVKLTRRQREFLQLAASNSDGFVHCRGAMYVASGRGNAATMKGLVSRGLMEDEPRGWTITPAGRAALAPVPPAPEPSAPLSPDWPVDPNWLDKQPAPARPSVEAERAAEYEYKASEEEIIAMGGTPEPELSEIEADILHTVKIAPLPLRFADHLKPDSKKAFENLRDRGLIKMSSIDDRYYITLAGAKALDAERHEGA